MSEARRVEKSDIVVTASDSRVPDETCRTLGQTTPPHPTGLSVCLSVSSLEKSDIVVTASDSRVPDEACTVCSDSRAVGVQTRKPRLRGGRRDGERWNMTDVVVSLVCHARSRHATRPAGCWEWWWWGGADRMLDFLHAKIILFGRVRANVNSNLKQQQPQTTYMYSYTDKGQEGEG